MDPFALGLTLSIELSLRAHPFECAERCDAGHLEDSKWDERIVLCTFDRSNYFVLRFVEILFRRLPFNGVIEYRADLCRTKFLHSWLAFLDRLAPTELFEDGRFDQTFDREP